MIIIGHRGARGLAPENTLAAIKAGLAAGADWIEIDVRATKDGHTIVFHDATTARLANKKVLIGQTMAATLEKIKAKGQPIPTLKDAVAAMDGKATLNVEIKSFGCINEVVRTKRHYPNLVISSFSRGILDKVAAQDPKIKRALLQAVNPFAFKAIKGLYAVGFHHLFAPRSAIAAAKKQGLFTYVYTVNEPERALTLHRRGIDGVVTDVPDIMHAAIHKNTNWPRQT